tara:strand:- start:47 stop:403 length:357 start_codon:yes stop_codon:yes gene_type:complete
MKKYLFIVLLVGVCFGQAKDENAGKIIESAGNDIVEFVNDNYRAFYIGLAGLVILDYGLKNPIKTSEGYSGSTYTINPATYFGFAIIGYSAFEQFMNLRKLRLAEEKLKKAGKKINKQ